MLLQIISDPATANWVIAIILTILGFLLVRILNRLEKTQEQHGERLNDVEQDISFFKGQSMKKG